MHHFLEGFHPVMQPAWVRGGLLAQHESPCRAACSSGHHAAFTARRIRSPAQRPRAAALHDDRRVHRFPAAAALDAQAFTDGAGDPGASSSSGGSSGDDDMGSTAAAQEHNAAAEDVSLQEAQRRLKRAADLLRMVHLMAPSEPDSFNAALVIW